MRLITLVVSLAASLQAGPTLISHGCGGSSTGASAPASITLDSTGADFIAIVAAEYGSPETISDNKSNTWIKAIQGISSGGTEQVSIWYAATPTVGTGHMFTITGNYSGSCVLAFSGVVASSPADGPGSSAANASVTSISPGSITPSQTGDLLITGMSINLNATTDSTSVDSGFTISDQLPGIASISVPCFVGWKAQNTAAPVTLTWSGGSTTNRATAVAAFKALTLSAVRHRVSNP